MGRLTPQEVYAMEMMEQVAETLLWSSLISLPLADPDDTSYEPELDPKIPAELRAHEGHGYDAFFNADDFAAGELDGVTADVEDFVEKYWDIVQDYRPADIGHNYVLSRGGHGTGFWDTGRPSAPWDEETGRKLHDAVKDLADISLDVDYDDPEDITVRVHAY